MGYICLFFLQRFHFIPEFPYITFVLDELGLAHNTQDLRHGGNVDGVNDPYLTTLARFQSSVGSTLSSGNGAAESGVGGGQSDGRVEVLLGGDSASTVAVALSSGTVTMKSKYTASHSNYSISPTRSCRGQRQASMWKGGFRCRRW